jgi:O-antigen/teichoic acid export membrane protein
MNAERKVLKNSFGGILTLGVGSLLQLITFSLLARHLGTLEFGQYSYITAFAGAFQLFAEMGLTLVLVRDITLDKENVKKYMGEVLPLLWVLAFGTLVLMLLATRVLGLESRLLPPLYLAGIATVVTIQPNIYIAVFRAFEHMEINYLGSILQKVLFLGFIYWLVLRDHGDAFARKLIDTFWSTSTEVSLPLVSTFLALLMANVLVWFLYYLIAIWKYGRFKPGINLKYCISLLKEAVPLGFGGILRKITWQIDTLILGILDTAVSVAFYSSAYKLLAALNMIPQVLAMPMFPYLTRVAEGSQEAFVEAYRKSLKFMWILSLPIAIGTTVLADRFILIVFGATYGGAAIALKILIWSSIFLFLSSQYRHVFTILRKQQLYTYLIVLSLVVNIGLDLALIPLFSYVGACFATLTTEILLYLVGHYLLRRLGVIIPVIPGALKPLLVGLITGAILYSVRNVSYLLLGFIGVINFGLYFVLLFLFGAFSKRELDGLRKLAKRS